MFVKSEDDDPERVVAVDDLAQGAVGGYLQVERR